MIVTVSENTRIELIEWMQVKRNKVKVIPNGVSPLFFATHADPGAAAGPRAALCRARRGSSQEF